MMPDPGSHPLLLALLLAAAGGMGAVARVLVGALLDTLFPWKGPARPGTLAVNVAGALAAGLVAGWGAGAASGAGTASSLAWILTVGFLGSFTTFSTWMLEGWTGLQDPASRRNAIGYLLLASVAGVGAAMLGLTLGQGLSPGG